jgi:hypothetical protein
LRPVGFQQVQDSAGIEIGFPAAFARAMRLDPTRVIRLNDLDGDFTQLGAFGGNLVMQAGLGKHLQTQGANRVGQGIH